MKTLLIAALLAALAVPAFADEVTEWQMRRRQEEQRQQLEEIRKRQAEQQRQIEEQNRRLEMLRRQQRSTGTLGEGLGRGLGR